MSTTQPHFLVTGGQNPKNLSYMWRRVSNHLFQGGDESRSLRVWQLQQFVLEGCGDEALQSQPEVMWVRGQALHQAPGQGHSLSTEGLLMLHHLVVTAFKQKSMNNNLKRKESITVLLDYYIIITTTYFTCYHCYKWLWKNSKKMIIITTITITIILLIISSSSSIHYKSNLSYFA